MHFLSLSFGQLPIYRMGSNDAGAIEKDNSLSKSLCLRRGVGKWQRLFTHLKLAGGSGSEDVDLVKAQETSVAILPAGSLLLASQSHV